MEVIKLLTRSIRSAFDIVPVLLRVTLSLVVTFNFKFTLYQNVLIRIPNVFTISDFETLWLLFTLDVARVDSRSASMTGKAGKYK